MDSLLIKQASSMGVSVLTAILLASSVGIINPTVVALNNGLGRTPAMGYNTWNAFHENSACAC